MKENRKGDIFMSLVNTPSGNRLHIGIFGKRNSGKSSLLNAITGQEIALVSDASHLQEHGKFLVTEHGIFELPE